MVLGRYWGCIGKYLVILGQFRAVTVVGQYRAHTCLFLSKGLYVIQIYGDLVGSYRSLTVGQTDYKI